MFTKPSLAIDQILPQQGSAQVRIQELKTCCSECVGACLLTGSSLGSTKNKRFFGKPWPVLPLADSDRFQLRQICLWIHTNTFYNMDKYFLKCVWACLLTGKYKTTRGFWSSPGLSYPGWLRQALSDKIKLLSHPVADFWPKQLRISIFWFWELCSVLKS